MKGPASDSAPGPSREIRGPIRKQGLNGISGSAIRILAVAAMVGLGACKPVNNGSSRRESGDITVACYYFPGYHPDEPRINKLKGQGWSEWELVRKARPRFPGHHQPKVPLWGYTDESDPGVMEQKIAAASDHGIDVFIFDWYWDNEGIYWEGGLEDGYMKATNKDRLRFALMWAMWDFYDLFPFSRGEPVEVLWPGRITRETFDSACNYIIEKYFRQPSYWKIDGKPYFSFYSLDLLVESFGSIRAARKALDGFRDRARLAGFPDIHLNAVFKRTGEFLESKDSAAQVNLIHELGFNSVTSYVWIHNVKLPELKTPYDSVREQYFSFWDRADSLLEVPYFPNVTVGWDPSPRTVQEGPYGNFGYPYTNTISGNTPARFRQALLDTRQRLLESKGPQIITINAWNEWTEGSYLEPDRESGYKYLQAIKEVFRN